MSSEHCICILGTGRLGTGMAENLLAKHKTVHVWNRNPERAKPLAQHGAHVFASAAEAVSGAGRVHIVLSEDDAVDAVLGSAAPGLGADTPLFDHSTNRPDRVAARAERVPNYVHAPVFMAPSDARGATGLMLSSGRAELVEKFRPELEMMTGKLWYVGDRPDLAAIYKLLGNGMLLSLSGALGDLFSIGRGTGLGPEDVMKLFEVFKPVNMLDRIGKRVASGGIEPSSFSLAMARKDARLMQESAQDPLLVISGVAAAMDRGLEKGDGERDFVVFNNYRK